MERKDISVVIATRNRAESITTCLAHLEQQSFPGARYEVVVVDVGSTDATFEIIERHAAGAPMRTRALRLGAGGFVQACNRGIEAAKGRWVLTLDDDLLASPNLVERHVRAQEAWGGSACIVGDVALHPQLHPKAFTRWFMPEERRQLPENEPLGYLDWRRSNLSLPRELLLDAGGLDPSFPFPHFDDAELAWRLAQRGIEGHYEPTACAYVWQQADFEAECRRYYAKGYAMFTLLEKTHAPDVLERYVPERTLARRVWDRIAMPFYRHACRRGADEQHLFSALYARVLRYQLCRGYRDASRGRPPRKDALEV